MYFASSKGLIDNVAKLIQQCADLDAFYANTGTALVAVAQAGHTAIVQLLMDSGANFDAHGMSQYTAIGYSLLAH